MENFPTLSIAPTVDGFTEEVAKDPTIKTDFENGFYQTRPAFTRIPRKFTVTYHAMSDSDKNTLQNFEKTVLVGCDAFTWTHPKTSTQYTVRFDAPIKYTLILPNYWDIEFILVEV